MADHLELYRTAQSLPALFFNSAEGKKRKPFLWTKQHGAYVSQSWGKIHGDIVSLAKALKNMGVNAGDRVCLISENRSEWLVSDIGIMLSGAVTVPSYTVIPPLFEGVAE